MNFAKAAGVSTAAITGTKAGGSIVKSLISATSTSSSSEKKSSDDSTPTQATQTKSEAILRLMYSNPGASASKAVADGTKEITDWYAQKNRVSQAEAAAYPGKQQTAAMIGGAFSAAAQGLSQMFAGKKKGGEGGGGRGGRRSSGGEEGGGDEGEMASRGGGRCGPGGCTASTDAMKGLDTNQAIKNATEPKPLDSSLNQQDQQMAMKSSADAAVQQQQIQEQPEPPPPPPEPLANQGTMAA